MPVSHKRAQSEQWNKGDSAKWSIYGSLVIPSRKLANRLRMSLSARVSNTHKSLPCPIFM